MDNIIKIDNSFIISYHLNMLANAPTYRVDSLGYIPPLLFAKWVSDNAKKTGFLKSLRLPANRDYTYDADAKTPEELVEAVLPGSILTPLGKNGGECENEDPLVLQTHREFLEHVARVIGTLPLGNIKKEELGRIFDSYSRGTAGTLKNNIYDWTFFAEDIIKKIAGPVKEAYDPCCKFGQLLMSMEARTYIGSDVNRQIGTVAYISSCLNGKRMELADNPISHPILNPDGSLRQFDLVVSNIELIPSEKKYLDISLDVYNRFKYCRDSTELNLSVMLSHALACTKEDGLCALVAPGTCGSILQGMKHLEASQFIRDDMLEAVIRLRDEQRLNSMGHTTFPLTFLFIFRKNKPAERKGKVIFIDAKTYADMDKWGTDDEELIDRIYHSYDEFCNIHGFSRVVTNEEILFSRMIDLNPQFYTTVMKVPKTMNLEEARKELIKMEGKRLAVLTEILDLMEEMKETP